MDLCRHRPDCALSQCIRSGGQAFQKIAFLHPLAPNGSEPPFLVAQTIVLLTFLWLGFGAVRKFHPEALAPARR